MPTYTIQLHKPYRSFSIYKEDTLLVSVKFPSFWSNNAVVLLDGKDYEMMPVSWWKRSTQLIKDDTVIATLKPNVFDKAQILESKGLNQWYTIKARGFLKAGFQLISTNDEVLAEIIPNWGFRQRYDLIISDNFIDSLKSHIGLMMLVHHCRGVERAARS